MWRLLKLCAAVMIIGSGLPLAAQAVISGQVNYQGTSVPYAPIQVCWVTSVGTPCVPVSNLYSDYNLTHSVANPNAADQYGNYTFYAATLSAPSFYVVQVTPTPGVIWSYVVAGGGGTTINALTVATSGGAAPNSTFNGSGPVTIDYHSVGAQPELSLLKGTYIDGDLCSYTTSGTLLHCDTAPYSLPSTVVQTNQANTYDAHLQDFSAASVRLPVTQTNSTVVIASQTAGSGYTSVPGISLSGGTCSTAPTLTGSIYGSPAPVYFWLTNTPVCTVLPNVVLTGGGGSSAAVVLGFAGTNVAATSATGAVVAQAQSGSGNAVNANQPTIFRPILQDPVIAQAPGNPIEQGLYCEDGVTPFLFNINGSDELILSSCGYGGLVAFRMGENVGNSDLASFGYTGTGVLHINDAVHPGIDFNLFNSLGSLPGSQGLNFYTNTGGTLQVSPPSGSGYTGVGACTVSGGTLVSGSADTCTAAIVGGGNLVQVTLAGTGVYSVAPGCSVAGLVGGIGFQCAFFINNANTPGYTLYDTQDGKLHYASGSVLSPGSDLFSVDHLGNVTSSGTGCGSGSYVKSDGTGCGSPSGAFSAGGDLSGSSSSQQVIGLKTVPFCTGFTPTNLQYLQYTTASSPNPCYTAASGSGAFAGGAGTSFQDALEIAAPANPASTYDRLYLDSTAHQLKCLTSSGGSCMPSGSMTYPGAGIGVSTGSAWGTSLTAPTGALVGAGQANTYTTGLQDFSSATMKLPASYTIAGPYTITQPGATGTLALTSAIPSVGTWGALNYPTWVSGTPFVKMTAAGTFALDTSTYLTASGISGMTAGQVPIAATATTVTSSKAIQGTDTNLMSSGTISGTSALLCTDANGGATTASCPAVGSGVVTAAAQYDVPYYTQAGSTAQVGGAAIAGFQYDSTGGAPAAATQGNLGTLINVTSGQALISGGSGSAVTGKALAGSGAGITTGPASGVISGDISTYTGTGGQIADGGTFASNIPAQYKYGSCTEAWGGSGTSFALTSGDDAVINNSCYNDSGVTRTITAVKCRSSASSNTTTVNPTFGSAGTGTTILSGALTCGNSYAFSSTGTVNNASWTTGAGIDPAMAGTLTGTSIAMIVEYTY